jgi:hypothetical protein
MFGDPNWPLTAVLIEHRWVARALQWLTILGETGALLAIVWPRARPYVGLTLVGFHVGATGVFRWGFHVNLVMVALLLLPIDRWLAVRASPRRRGAACTTVPECAETCATALVRPAPPDCTIDTSDDRRL